MALTLTNITKKYGTKTIINNLSYEFPENGIVGITGPSGCGKTTLFRLISGLESPDYGLITGNNCNFSYVFQEDRLIPTISAIQNVSIVSSIELAKTWLARVELSDEIDKLPPDMSGGMRRRTAIARALAYNGDILLLDEPFTGLEFELKAKIIPYIKQYSENHLVLLITHDQQEQLLAETCVDLS